MEHTNQSRTVQAVEITLDILDLLHQRNGARVTEIANELERSKGTVHSHLATLLDREYIVKEGEEYKLSLRYLEFGEAVKQRLDIYGIIQTELDDLADESGEVAQFATEEHGQIVYLYKSKGEKAVETASSVGTRTHLHPTALGKAILAYYPRERIDEIVKQHGLPEYTDQTITSRDELLEELTTIRQRGYAFDDEEVIEGLRCVAAPVKIDGEVFGAVSISGPSSRVKEQRFREDLPDKVLRSANVIEINAKFS